MPNTSAVNIREIKLLIIDLDGVVWRRQVVVPGAGEAIGRLRASGYQTVFVTNNSGTSRRQVVEKLSRFGIPATSEDVLSSSRTTAEYIRKESETARVLVLGSEGLTEEIAGAGLSVVTDPGVADYVAVGYDATLSYERLSTALTALLAGARFIATNDDGLLPSENGYLPGAGAVVGAVRGMIKREPDMVVGKPNRAFLGDLLKRMGVTQKQCMVIGDSLASDVAFAKQLGMVSVLVLTGNTRSRDEAEGAKDAADYVLDSIAQIPCLLGLDGEREGLGVRSRRFL